MVSSCIVVKTDWLFSHKVATLVADKVVCWWFSSSGKLLLLKFQFSSVRVVPSTYLYLRELLQYLARLHLLIW